MPKRLSSRPRSSSSSVRRARTQFFTFFLVSLSRALTGALGCCPSVTLHALSLHDDREALGELPLEPVLRLVELAFQLARLLRSESPTTELRERPPFERPIGWRWRRFFLLWAPEVE